MRNRQFLIGLCFVLFGCSFYSFGQQTEWTGKVLSEKTNEPLIGVTVRVKDVGTGTITDMEGNYKIKAAAGQVLRFTYVGYFPFELKLKNNQSHSNVLLNESNLSLNEVVVVGYGVQKKESLVGSISAAKGEELQKIGNVTSVSEALQGILPGVVSIMTDGKPGADEATITIRGKSSWVSSEPLVLVDGVERNMNDLDMNEIVSLSVLKDASATAVYGVKGANGVILVTTKRGANAKPKINFST
ncbi:MAG: carboxypeptidase-like regulatory domain-containing protein, partial [Dysgonomonas sp.]